MHDESDRDEEAYWVARLRAKGYTVQAGTGTGGIPFEPEVAFTPPVDRDGVDSMQRRSASTVKQMSEQADDPTVPDWVRRMRADGYTVRIGTDPTPLPIEPEFSFTLPGDQDCVDALKGPAVSDAELPVTPLAPTVAQMPNGADRPEEPYWVAGLRAKGYTVQVGTGTDGLPFEPEVAFTPPTDRDRVEALEGQAEPPLRSGASTATQMADEAGRPEEPYWVARLRADGYTVRIGTDPTPLPFEPEDHFGPPYETDSRHHWRLTSLVRKLWNAGRLFKRHITHP